jgi:hypothetical protein
MGKGENEAKQEEKGESKHIVQGKFQSRPKRKTGR